MPAAAFGRPRYFCGLAAIKPTSGRVPRTGQFPMPLGARNPVFHVSLIARKVSDLALALPIISGPDFLVDSTIVAMPLGDPTGIALAGLKLAFFEDDGAAAPIKEIAAAVRDAQRLSVKPASRSKKKGHRIWKKAATVYHDMSFAGMAAPAPAHS